MSLKLHQPQEAVFACQAPRSMFRGSLTWCVCVCDGTEYSCFPVVTDMNECLHYFVSSDSVTHSPGSVRPLSCVCVQSHMCLCFVYLYIPMKVYVCLSVFLSACLSLSLYVRPSVCVWGYVIRAQLSKSFEFYVCLIILVTVSFMHMTRIAVLCTLQHFSLTPLQFPCMTCNCISGMYLTNGTVFHFRMKPGGKGLLLTCEKNKR